MSEPLQVKPADQASLASDPIAADKSPIVAKISAEVFTKGLALLATSAWKLRMRIIDEETKEPRTEIGKDDVRKMVRQLDSMFEALKSLGIEVRDRTGEAFNYGLPEKVVSSSIQIGLTKELIVETIKPTVYWMNQIAQNGEVVIATPSEAKS
jgi:hypothetical protein